jgi:hypothetical protein
VLEAGVKALAHLTQDNETVQLKIAEENGLTDGLRLALAQRDNHTTQKWALEILNNLANILPKDPNACIGLAQLVAFREELGSPDQKPGN